MATIDHVIPRYQGGPDDESNMVSSCRLCNNRRSHETNCGFPDGSLLGKFDPDKGIIPKRVTKKKAAPSPAKVALTGDEKKAIMAGTGLVCSKKTEDVLREQRDQGLLRITKLTEENGLLEKELKVYRAVVIEQERKLKEKAIWWKIRKRLAEWLAP